MVDQRVFKHGPIDVASANQVSDLEWKDVVKLSSSAYKILYFQHASSSYVLMYLKFTIRRKVPLFRIV